MILKLQQFIYQQLDYLSSSTKVSGIYYYHVPANSNFPYIYVGDFQDVLKHGSKEISFKVTIFLREKSLKAMLELAEEIKTLLLSNQNIRCLEEKIQLQNDGVTHQIILLFKAKEYIWQMQLYLKLQQQWNLIGGIKSSKMEIASQIVDITNVSSRLWRELMPTASLKYVNISAEGVFSNSFAESSITNIALAGEIKEYKLEFAKDKKIQGKFQITYYQRYGKIDEEERYSINISSSGAVL